MKSLTQIEFKPLLELILQCMNKQRNIGFVGNLGSGKTYLIQNVMHELGFDKNRVNSPSYNFCFEYLFKNFQIHHFDLYQTRDENQLFEIGLFDSMHQNEVHTFIEWADRYQNILEQCELIIQIEHQTENDSRNYFYKMRL